MGKRHDKEWMFRLAQAMPKPTNSQRTELRTLNPPKPVPEPPGFRFSGKEVALTLLATFLGIGGYASNDPLIVIPCLAISLIVFGYLCFKHPGKPGGRLGVFAVGLVVVILLSMRLYTRNRPAAPASVDLPAKAETSDHFVDLKDLFESDWPNLPSYYSETSLESPALSSHKIKLEWRLNGDFVAGSKFLVIYIDSPDATPDDVIKACQFIAYDSRQFINYTNSNLDVTGQSADDPVPAHFKDLVFSGRVFLYYADARFSLQQKARIETLFEKRGMSIEFRGDDYRWLHKDDRASLRKDPLKPNSFILPDPKKSPPGIFFEIVNLNKTTLSNPRRKFFVPNDRSLNQLH